MLSRPLPLVCALLVAPLLAATAAAAPITLRDGEAEVVIDPTSPDGIRDWRMSGLDHLKKQWFWIIGDGGAGSLDKLTVTATRATDSDGDGDRDTLVVHYQGLEGAFELEIAWSLQDQGRQIGWRNSRKSSLTTQLVLTRTKVEGAFNIDLHRYVDLDLGATPADGRVVIAPATPSFNFSMHQLITQENEPGAPLAIYQAAMLPRPVPFVGVANPPDGNSPENLSCDISEYPLALDALNADPLPMFGFGNGQTDSPGGDDVTFTHAIHTDFSFGQSYGWTIAEELTASITIFRIVELNDMFDDLVAESLIVGVGGPNNAPIRLSLLGVLLDAAEAFEMAKLDAQKCAVLEAARARSDGQPKPGDWIQGQGLAAWQEALQNVLKAEGCSVPPPPPTDNPNS